MAANSTDTSPIIDFSGNIYWPEGKHRKKRLGNHQTESRDLTGSVDLINQWVERCVIDLSLCPFAAAPYRSGRVRIVVCDAISDEGFLATIKTELHRLAKPLTKLQANQQANQQARPPKTEADLVETTLIASTAALPDFLDFNDFLTSVEALLQHDNLEADFQIASFHPCYRFAGVDEDDAGNYTNRAPFPIVQWLRADTVSRAADAMDTLAIPEANIKTLKGLESEKLRALFPWTKTAAD